MVELVLAGFGLLVCALLLGWHVIPSSRRRRLIDRWQGAVSQLKARRRAVQGRRHAVRTAHDAIERARRRAKAGPAARDGTVERRRRTQRDPPH